MTSGNTTAGYASPALIEDCLTAGADFRLITPKGAVVAFMRYEPQDAPFSSDRHEGWKVRFGHEAGDDADFTMDCVSIRVRDLEGAPEYRLRLDLLDDDFVHPKWIWLPYGTDMELIGAEG